MKLSTTNHLGPLTIEAGYFSGNNPSALSITILEWLEGCCGNPGYLLLFSISIHRFALSMGIDFDWKRNHATKEAK